MTRTPFRLCDIGEAFTWVDLRDFVANLPPTGDCAFYRAQYPKSWWWEPSFDFMAAILNSLQWANWQRGGGKGDKPRPIKRPKDPPKKGPKSAEELQNRKQLVKRREVTDGN